LFRIAALFTSTEIDPPPLSLLPKCPALKIKDDKRCVDRPKGMEGKSSSSLSRRSSSASTPSSSSYNTSNIIENGGQKILLLEQEVQLSLHTLLLLLQNIKHSEWRTEDPPP
jgi:hypothetical protein